MVYKSIGRTVAIQKLAWLVRHAIYWCLLLNCLPLDKEHISHWLPAQICAPFQPTQRSSVWGAPLKCLQFAVAKDIIDESRKNKAESSLVDYKEQFLEGVISFGRV